MINAISAADIAFIMSSSSIECSRPIRVFIVSLMYNKKCYMVVGSGCNEFCKWSCMFKKHSCTCVNI